MKLPRSARGTSAPPTSMSLQNASIRLSNATQFRPRTRNQLHQHRETTPQTHDTYERLGSPFAFHQNRSRAGTPSTVASLTESLHPPMGQGRPSTRAYWLRSSCESEWECRVNQLQTPADLRVLI